MPESTVCTICSPLYRRNLTCLIISCSIIIRQRLRRLVSTCRS